PRPDDRGLDAPQGGRARSGPCGSRRRPRCVRHRPVVPTYRPLPRTVRQMRAQFVFSEVVTGLRRNVTMTIAMILTTAISLMMFGAGLLFTETVNRTEQNFIDDLEVRIFLNKDI